ncbi:uncharacterized protein LOC130669771 isoform X2 [Microplitis mediator]|uniref:uncharacterized protein LOC130669771 isoform X2 n=1 Tax=Microplitis mediator TaxID=375433 RepID=UPI0025577D99|nr:uncharacterized protein LOC130669771 isoform X2 [Microplitis mediator]
MASRDKKPLASSKAKQKTNNASLSPSSSRTNKNDSNDNNNRNKTVLALIASIPSRRQKITARKSTAANYSGNYTSRLRSVPSLIDDNKSTATTEDIGLDTTLYPKMRPKQFAVKSTGSIPSPSYYPSRLKSVPSSVNNNKSPATNIVLGNSKARGSNQEQSIEFGGSLIDKNSHGTSCSSTNSTATATVTTTTQSSSPKSNKKLKTVSPESQLKSAKVTNKISERKKSIVRNSGKLKNSVDSTIDEVVALMISGTETDELPPVDPDNKLEGKVTRSKKMLFEECDIKKELIEAEEETKSEDESVETNSEGGSQGNQSKRRVSQRSLRNGKLRQLDLMEDKKVRRNAEDETDNADDESSNVESGGQNEVTDTDDNTETEKNNNSEQVDRSVEGEQPGGPNLRSKAKAKSTDTPITVEDTPVIDSKVATAGIKSCADEPTRKSSGYELLRKNCLLGKLTVGDKQSLKPRRSSLNIDVKKTMGPLYGSEKIDGVVAKSQIDQMIEDIKLNIAKSIESKIESKMLSLEKSLGINKNFDIPKIEEIVAPLSTETQKVIVLDKNNDEEVKPDVSKLETVANTSTDNNNSVPKVADTAKEIEKLVMGDNVEDKQQIAESAETSKDKDTAAADADVDADADAVADADADNTPVTSKESATESQSENDQSQSSLQSDESLEVATTTATATAEEDETLSCDDKVSEEESQMETIPVESCDPQAKETEEETLETISLEVERLVTEPLPTNLKDTQSNDSEEDDNLEMDVEMTENNDEEKENKDEVVEKIDQVVENDDEDMENKDEVEKMDDEVKDDDEVVKENEEKTIDEVVEESVVNEEVEESVVNEEVEEEEKEDDDNDDHDDEEVVKHDIDNNEVSVEKVNDEVTDVEQELKTEEKQKSVTPEPSSSSQIDKSAKNTPEKAAEVAAPVEDEIKSREEKSSDVNKSGVEEGRRVLRARDKLRKSEKALKAAEASGEVKSDDSKINSSADETVESGIKSKDETEAPVVVKIEEPEPITRTRRSRDVKKRKELETSPQSLKSKRSRRDTKKLDQQKEETLLDNEVATINENKRSLSVDKLTKRIEGTKSLRVFSPSETTRDKNIDNRSKSENDIEPSKSGKTVQLSRDRCDSIKPKEPSVNPAAEQIENVEVIAEETSGDAVPAIALTEVSDNESKAGKISESVLKDSDEASTSGESTSSVSFKILETPEDKARKESILRILGLESLEKAAERLHQKAKREQYTGTLKTIIRVSKDKDKDKKQSRSPLKMVLKQGRNDGDGGDASEFYTIQKELGTSGLGDSSSDEEHEDTSFKTRPRLIIPEKYSSFSIHPGRPCADNCCYCFGKFGSLDTPMHLAQLKSDERRKKILLTEGHLNKDSCLCDACYRHVDRKANMSPTNTSSKPQRVHRQLLVSKCYVKDCRDPARHTVKRRWIHKIKPCIQNQVIIDVNPEPSQHTSMYFCVDHYAIIEQFLICSLCTRRLTRNQTHHLSASETNELNRLLEQQRIPVSVTAGTFLCKLCRYFMTTQFKYKDIENMSANNKTFTKGYRKRLLELHNIELMDDDDEESSSTQGMSIKDKRKKSKSLNKSASSVGSGGAGGSAGNNSASGSGPSKSPTDNLDKSTSEKSTPEPVKSNPPATSQIEATENRESFVDQRPKASNEENTTTETQILDLESAVEKLKKRKALDQHLYSTTSPVFNNNNNNNSSNNNNNNNDNSSDVVEILAMDKEVTLTRLPKRPRLNNDITPVVQRLGANPSISVRTLFPGEEEMGLHANVEFSNVREVTPQGWEKCATIIQYDRDTKLLWQELQRPYGNQSSFLRHLILLEKYYRSGDLVLAPNASRNAINYSTSVQNRLISYEGPEKMDEPITDPLPTEFSNSRRLSGGYMMERDRLSTGTPSTSTLLNTTSINNPTSVKSNFNQQLQQQSQQLNTKSNPPRILKINSGVSIIKKPPPSLQRLNLPSASGSNNSNSNNNNNNTNNNNNNNNNNSNNNSNNSSSITNHTANGSAKRKDGFPNKITGSTSGGKVIHMSEPDFKRLQSLKKQKMLSEKMTTSLSSPSSSPSTSASTSTSLSSLTNSTAVTNVNANLQQQQKTAQVARQNIQFHEHIRMQQEMLNRQSRGDFEPIICDVRSLINENTPTQNLINNLNLPKSIQVTTKPSSNNPIPILPKMPKSLTVIPQTIHRTVDK